MGIDLSNVKCHFNRPVDCMYARKYLTPTKLGTTENRSCNDMENTFKVFSSIRETLTYQCAHIRVR